MPRIEANVPDAAVEQIREIQKYLNEMSAKDILTGLKFAKSRRHATDAGILKSGRKSIVEKETHSITPEQAKWRLQNWDKMIQNYRMHNYSYPTISRIKKILKEKSLEN